MKQDLVDEFLALVDGGVESASLYRDDFEQAIELGNAGDRLARAVVSAAVSTFTMMELLAAQPEGMSCEVCKLRLAVSRRLSFSFILPTDPRAMGFMVTMWCDACVPTREVFSEFVAKEKAQLDMNPRLHREGQGHGQVGHA